MNHPTFRVFVALWTLICVLFACGPLGCHSVNVRHASGRPGQWHIPQMTAERFKDCGHLIQEGIEGGRRTVDAEVELDENGRVLEASTSGEPNPEVGMCLRVALRDMKVDTSVIDEAVLRSTSYANAGTIPNRLFIAEPVTVTVVVVIVFVDVIIEGALVALGVAVTATVAKEAVKAAQARSTPARKPHQPVREKWEKNGGTVRDNADGTTTYTRSDGAAVTYDKAGFPDFTPYRHPTVKDVQIEFSGKYDTDRARANAASNLTETPIGWRWHHHQDGKTMQLIRSDVHEDFFHTGGMAGTRR